MCNKTFYFFLFYSLFFFDWLIYNTALLININVLVLYSKQFSFSPALQNHLHTYLNVQILKSYSIFPSGDTILPLEIDLKSILCYLFISTFPSIQKNCILVFCMVKRTHKPMVFKLLSVSPTFLFRYSISWPIYIRFSFFSLKVW